jgi:methionine-rich copper-binding protein CopC
VSKIHTAIIALALAAALSFAQGAAAHAFLERAEPKVGSRLDAPPTEVRLWFTQALEPSLCVVRIDGPPGFGGTKPAATASDPRELVVPLGKPAPVGRYVVHWRVVSVDSHMTQGDFGFRVNR